MSRHLASLVLLLLTGCDGGDADNTSEPDPSPEASIEAPTVGHIGQCDTAFGLGSGTVHVRSWGNDATADGTGLRPFATIDAALSHQVGAGAFGSGCHTLDFEADANGTPLVPGQRVEHAYADWGVTIEAHHKNFNQPAEAVVFDTSTPTKQTADLGTPNLHYGGPGMGRGGLSNSVPLGNVLIRPQQTSDKNNDGIIDNPSDHSGGAGFVFRFNNDVCIQRLTLLDVSTKNASLVFADADGTVLSTLEPETNGDNSVTEVHTNTCGVRSLTVVLHGGGALDNIEFCDDIPPLTPAPKAHLSLGRGTFSTNLTVPPQHELTIEGCSAAATQITARHGSKPTVLADGGRLSLARLTVAGGSPALWGRNHADITLDHVRVSDSATTGIAVTAGSSLTASHIAVLHSTSSSSGNMGWGIAAQDSELLLADALVLGAQEIGVFGDASVMSMNSVEVVGTTPSFNIVRSRGIQLQNSTEALLHDLRLSQNSIGLLGLDLSLLQADNILIDITGQGIVYDPSTGILIDITGQGFLGATNSDGIVLVGLDAQPYPVSLSNSTILESSRAAVLLDSVEAELNGNNAAANSLTIHGKRMFQQGTAQVVGSDASLVHTLKASEELIVPHNPAVLRLND